MTGDENTTNYRPLEEILARLPRERREDVRYRAGQGEIPVLPEDIRIERNRMFIEGIGWSEVPGLDPANITLENIELLFVIRREGNLMLEVALKEAPPSSDTYEALKKISPFRTKNAIDKYLRKASPAVAREMRSRLKRSHIPFLPDQLKVIKGRVFLPVNEDGIELEGIDPQAIQNIVLVFVVSNPAGSDFVEIIWRTN
jgi:hypothetical protein